MAQALAATGGGDGTHGSASSGSASSGGGATGGDGGGDEGRAIRSASLRHALSGGVAGAFSKTCTAPLARMVILYQVGP